MIFNNNKKKKSNSKMPGVSVEAAASYHFDWGTGRFCE
jgi:hypothetical protein